MISQPLEWLIRKGKRNYLGPFDAATVKKLISEAELNPYDEIARSDQPWIFLKDCPAFAKYVEAMIPHGSEEKTVNLGQDEVTRVTLPGTPPQERLSKSIPKRGSEPPVIDLSLKTPEASKGWVRLGIGMTCLVLGGVGYGLYSVYTTRSSQLPKEKRSFSEKVPPDFEQLSKAVNEFNVYYFRGKLFEQAELYSEALALYEKALSFRPDDMDAQTRKLALQLKVKEPKVEWIRSEFLKLLSREGIANQQISVIQNYLGLLELYRDHYAQALSHFKAALLKEDASASVHFNTGVAYFFMQQYYSAREHFDRAVKLEPSQPSLYIYLGRTLQKLGKNEEAIQEYVNASRINPQLYLPYLYLGLIHLKLDENKAVYYLEQMVTRDPDYEFRISKDARFMQEQVNYDFILKTYAFLLKEKKQSSALMAGYGLLHFLKGDEVMADQWLRKALEKDPKNATTHTILGYRYLKQGFLPKALEHLHIALRYHYQNSLTHVLIADIYGRLGRHEDAIEHCRKVFVFDPYYVRAYDTLGRSLLALDRTSEALQAFQKALEYDPNYVPARRKLLELSK